MIEIDKKLVVWMLNYIRECEQTIDGEWGTGQSWQELENKNKLPKEYYKIREILDTNEVKYKKGRWKDKKIKNGKGK